MTNDQVVVLAAALLGALVGGAITVVGQVVLDRARERARGREAAAMLRGEIARAQTSLAMLLVAAEKKDLKEGDLSGYSLLTPVGAYFDSLGLSVASKMPVNWYTHIMSVYARWTATMAIARKLEETQKIAKVDLVYVKDWLSDADAGQALLLLVAQRWWVRRLRYRKLESAVNAYFVVDDAAVRGSIEAAGLENYFQFRKSQPK